MKHLYKNAFGLLTLAMAILLLSACEQDPQLKKYEYPMPEVTGMTPNVGYVSSQVIITGTNFGDRTEPVKVFFGGVEATKVLMCKNNRIAVEVPGDALSGDVTLRVWTNEVGVIGQYTVLPTPYVISIRSNNEAGTGVAEKGDIITISGENFGTNQDDVEVSFNGTPAESVTLVDESTITAVTPEHYLSGNVIVTIRGFAMTGSSMFNPTLKGDVTAVYLTNYKQPFMAEEAQTGDWNTPLGWMQNNAMKNPTGCLQIDKQGLTSLTFQNGWGKNAYQNGKVYQAMILRKGTYRLEASYTSSYVPAGDNKVFLVMAKGADETAIPNVTDMAVLNGANGAYAEFTDRSSSGSDLKEGVLTIPSFTLDGNAEMVLGFVSSIQTRDTYFKVTEIKLILE